MKILLHQSYRKLKDIAFEDVPVVEVSTATIKKCLKENHLNYEDGFTCFIIKCVFCNHDNKSSIYVNKTTGKYAILCYFKYIILVSYTFTFCYFALLNLGLFMCSSCKKMGQWDKLNSFLTANKQSKKWKTIMSLQAEFREQELLKETLIAINNTTTQLKNLEDNDVSDILMRFKISVSNYVLSFLIFNAAT